MTRNITGVPSGTAVPPRCLPDTGVGPAGAQGVVRGGRTTSSLITRSPRTSHCADPPGFQCTLRPTASRAGGAWTPPGCDRVRQVAPVRRRRRSQVRPPAEADDFLIRPFGTTPAGQFPASGRSAAGDYGHGHVATESLAWLGGRRRRAARAGRPVAGVGRPRRVPRPRKAESRAALRHPQCLPAAARGGTGRDNRTRLLLSGSSLPVMHRLFSAASPLRGLADPELTLRPLDFRRAARCSGIHDPRLALLVHAVVGGTPAYRRSVGDDAPRAPCDRSVDVNGRPARTSQGRPPHRPSTCPRTGWQNSPPGWPSTGSPAAAG